MAFCLGAQLIVRHSAPSTAPHGAPHAAAREPQLPPASSQRSGCLLSRVRRVLLWQASASASSSTDDQSPTSSPWCARAAPRSTSPPHMTVRPSRRRRRRSCARILPGTPHAFAWTVGRPAAVEWEPVGANQVPGRPPSRHACSCTRGIITRHPSRGSCPSRSAVFVLCLAAPRGAAGCTSCPHARTRGARSGFAAAASTARCSTAAAARRRPARYLRCGFGPLAAASTGWATGGPSRPRPRCWRASCCPTSTSIASWCRSIYMCAVDKYSGCKW